MIARQRTTRPADRPGFTIVEILVVIMLLALLAGMTYPLFRSDTPYQKLERSADRISSLMAMCRAEAMLQGHPFRLTWPTLVEDRDATIQPIVVHESDPVGAPGQYNEVAASWAREPVIEPGVELRLIQPGVFNIADLLGTKGLFVVPLEPSRVNVQFQPDGTADPAVFVLTIRPPGGDRQDELQQWVILDGITGLCKLREPPTLKQFEALLAQQDALPDLQFQEEEVEAPTPTEAGEQTLASVLNGGTGGLNMLSAGGLQELSSAIESLVASATTAGGTGTSASGTSTSGTSTPGASTPSTSTPGTSTPGRGGGRNPGAGGNPGGNRGGNRGGNPPGNVGNGNNNGGNNNTNDGNRPPRNGGRRGSGGGRGGR